MMDNIKLLRCRSIVALISILGVIAIAFNKPEYSSEALAILSLVLGNYFGGLPKQLDTASKVNQPDL